MNKKSLYAILFIMVFAFSILSLYTTFAYDEDAGRLDESDANYNLIYSIKDASNQQVTVATNESKFVDIMLNNTYNATVRYGLYYHLIEPRKLPDGVEIKLAQESVNALKDKIKPNEMKVITIEIDNNSSYNIELVIGALVGFENGRVEELLKDGDILIK